MRARTVVSQGISRRGVVTAALAGGLVLALRLPVRAADEPGEGPGNAAGQFAPNAFIRIDRSGKTTLVMPQVEMGQGIYTAVAMIVAEELDADFSQVALEHAPPSDKLYGNPMFGIQVTGNSNSIRAFWKPLRIAGAAARAMLVQAAAARWQVDPASCAAAAGKVTHAASGRVAAYGDLVDAASALPVPKDAKPKDPKDFTLIGKPLKRFDTPNKTDGKVVYAIDVVVPGMKFATLAQSPVLGGKVAHVDDSAAKKIAGVRQIVVLDDLVAVVGDHFWAAKSGLDALVVTWDDGANAKVDSRDIWNDLRAASRNDGVVAKSVGNVDKGLTEGERVDADYEVPFLAHATMEPQNCTVALTPGACEIWTGTQVITRVQAAGLAKAARRSGRQGDGAQSADRRRLRPPAPRSTWLLHVGAHRQAGKCAREKGDLESRGGHPARHLSAGLSPATSSPAGSLKDGKIVCVEIQDLRLVGVRALDPMPAFVNGIDIDAVDSAVDMPYDIPHRPGAIRARRAAGFDHRLLARRRTKQQCLCHRVLHGRTGPQGW